MATHTTPQDKKAYTSGQAVDYFKNIHDGLLAVGLTKTADTGQIDLTTAPTVTLSSANHDYGYNMFEFNDPYQTEYPIFVKVRYTNDNMSSTTQRVLLRIETGEGTDGAGNLTGKTDTRVWTDTQTTNTNAGTFSTNNISYSDGQLIINTAVTATSGTIPGNQYRFVAVGRRKDMSGNFTKGIYKVNVRGGGTSLGITSVTSEESHITEYRATLGVFSYLSNSVDDAYLTSVLKPYHWESENTSLDYNNSFPVFPMYVLTPVPEYIPGVIVTTEGVGNNATLTSDLGTGTKTFFATNAGVQRNDSLRIAHIWE